MNAQKVFSFFLVMMFVTFSLGAEPEKTVIGVTKIGGSGSDPKVSFILGESIRDNLLDIEDFKVLTLDKMEILLEQRSYEGSLQCLDRRCARKIGKIIGADQMIFSILKYENALYDFTVILVDVSKGRILNRLAFKPSIVFV